MEKKIDSLFLNNNSRISHLWRKELCQTRNYGNNILLEAITAWTYL